jgi:hypothetical protein
MNSIFKHSPVLKIVVLASCLAVSAGCGMKDWSPSKMFSLDNTWPFDDDDELDEGTPVRVVGTWTDTVKTQQGQKPQRGFAGRLAFYDAEHEKSLLVDGQLVVYAFDETDREATDTKPTRRYVFPADQMKLRMSETDLGATYSFWLPWDEAGGSKTEVSLICRFQPTKGAVVVSEQTRHRLPGPDPTPSAVAERKPPLLPEGVPSRPAQTTLQDLQAQRNAGGDGTRLANYEAPVAPQNVQMQAAAMPAQPAQQMSVTSIALPSNFQYRDFANAAQGAMGNVNAANLPANAATTQAVQQAGGVQYQMPSQPAAFPAMQPGMIPQQMPASGGINAPQVPIGQQQLQSQMSATQPYQPHAMPQVYAAPIQSFNSQVYARPSMTGPQPLTAQTNAQQIQPVSYQQVQPTAPPQYGQPMPGSMPTQTSVSYPNQVPGR